MESKLVDSYRRQREDILSSLLELQKYRNSFREARAVIGETREKIYFFMSRQDDRFYDRLQEFYRDNQPAHKMIMFLRQDLRTLRVKTFAFFEQYGYGNPMEHGRNFNRDLRDYVRAMTDRFRMEEDYLMPLIRRLSEETGTSVMNSSG